jgi:NACHT domain- and WD repeat-containing protein
MIVLRTSLVPIATRTFRVFVSSTFEDLKEERNALQRSVYPKLRKLCEQHGARFQAIDLRWGVRDEAGLDQRTMEICLAEIARCQKTGIKPNFIALLGDRYGWRPLPARIEQAEFETVRAQVAADNVTLVNHWYPQVDLNADPPEYLLRRREGDFEQRTNWEPLEARLGSTLRKAARAAGVSANALVKYEASATHQEILAGLSNPADRKHVFAFVRNPSRPKEPELAGLIRKLKDDLPTRNVFGFGEGDLETLCMHVSECLTEVIKAETAGFQSETALARERAAHDAFARERTGRFVGRAAVLGAVREYLEGNGGRVLVVHGPSGSGKSAIIARASEVREAIRRFIGAAPEASNGLTLLRSLCEEIGERYGQAGPLPATFNELVVLFQDRLRLATADRPIALFIDALDQLGAQDPAAAMDWLPRELPPNCRVVLSTIDVPPTLANAELVQVGPFSVDEAGDTLALWLGDAKRTLQDDQRNKVLESFRPAGLPLYLKLAFEEARLWRSFDSLDKCVPGDGLEGIIDQLFARLSDPGNHGPVLVSHALGFLAAARFGLREDEMLDVLAANDAVWKDFEGAMRHDLPGGIRQLPVIVWSRLYLDIEPYLTERAVPGGTTVNFYHRQLAERVPNDKSFHAELTRYFLRQSNWLAPQQANERKITELVRQQVSAELLEDVEATLTDFDFVAAKCAAGLVFDLQEDYRKVIAALPEAQAQLLQHRVRQAELARWGQTLIDCAREKRLPETEEIIQSADPWTDDRIGTEYKRFVDKPSRLDKLHAFAGFVGQELYSLIEFGSRTEFAVEHALNVAGAGPVQQAARLRLKSVTNPIFPRRWPTTMLYNPMPTLLRTLVGHTRRILGIGLTVDGQRAISCGEDKTLRVWDLESGACLRVIEGHLGSIACVWLTTSGLVVSGSADKTVRVWNLESGTCIRTLEGHSKGVNSVSAIPSGQRVVSGGLDCALRVWDVGSGVCIRILEGHAGAVRGISITPDGRHAVSCSDDRTVRMWDLESGELVRVLGIHADAVRGVSVTPDGARAISGGDDGTVRLWDLKSGLGVCLHHEESHLSQVSCVDFTPDGLRAISGMGETALLWDIKLGLCLPLEGHTAAVNCVGVTPDGRRAVSGSSDTTIRVWNLDSSAYQRRPKAHANPVGGLCVTSDGRRAVSDSESSHQWEKTTRVWDMEEGDCLRTLALDSHSDRSHLTASITKEGLRSLSVSWGHLEIWDLESAKCLRSLRILKGDDDRVDGASVTPDGRTAVSGSWDGTVRVWNLNGMRTVLPPVSVPSIWEIVQALILEWRESRACRRTLKGHTDHVTCASLAPCGRRAVTGSLDKTLRVWDMRRWSTRQRILRGHTDAVYCVSVSADGRRAISGSRDKSLRVWDLESGTCLHVLEGHRAQISSVSVTPDGLKAISGSWDTHVRVWDLESGQCLAVLLLKAPCTAVASSRGSLVAGTSTGEVLFFDVRGL